MRWYRGNVHAHSARSDGDINVAGVVAWFASRGYDWIAITDHNTGLGREHAEHLSERFKILVVPGNECTGTGHVVGLGVTESCDARKLKLNHPSVAKSLQTAVDWIRDQGGVPVLAHPNWGNTYGAEVMASIRDCNLFEVHNASPDCNTFAAGGKPGTDEIWNATLNLGARYFGLGSDDSHHYLPEKFHVGHATAHGGECSTYVECASLTVAHVLKALEEGRCVASAGAIPVKVRHSRSAYDIAIDDPYKHFTFTTQFVGPDGVLAEVHGRQASFSLRSRPSWVRARIFCSSGRYLWTQPVWC